MPEMWTPNFKDGIVEKNIKFPKDLLKSIELAAQDQGIELEKWVLTALNDSLAKSPR